MQNAEALACLKCGKLTNLSQRPATATKSRCFHVNARTYLYRGTPSLNLSFHLPAPEAGIVLVSRMANLLMPIAEAVERIWHQPTISTSRAEPATAVDDVTGKGRGRRAPDRSLLIPSALLRDCYGIVFLFTYKGAVGLSSEFGSGFLLTKVFKGTPDEKWSGPVAVMANGLGWGLQFGASKANHIIILNNQQAADVMSAGAKLDMGGSITVAAGPVGRDLQVKLHGNQRGIAATYSYSYSQGVMMGVALNSTLVWVNPWMTRAFYKDSSITVTDILEGRAGLNAYELHPSLLDLYLALDDAMHRPQRGRTVFGMGDASGMSTEEAASEVMGGARSLRERIMYAARMGAASVLEAVAQWGHGAGVAMQKGAETAQSVASKATETMGQVAQRGTETASYVVQRGTATAGQVAGVARDMGSAVASKAGATTEQLAQKGREAMEVAAQKGRAGAEMAMETGRHGVEMCRQGVETVAQKGGEVTETMAQKGRQGMEMGREGVETMAQRGRQGMEMGREGVETVAQKGRQGMEMGREGVEGMAQKGREGMRGAEKMAGAGGEGGWQGGEGMQQGMGGGAYVRGQPTMGAQPYMVVPMGQPTPAEHVGQVKLEAVGQTPQHVKEVLGLDKGSKYVPVAASPAGPPGSVLAGSG
eukprot:jgi/Mesvir1/14320/Mv09735-RA.1